ncbi:hypothetical protein GCM10027076_00180 [Nocardioides montaniterrae]
MLLTAVLVLLAPLSADAAAHHGTFTADTWTGTRYADTAYLGAGDDRADGGDGADTIYLGAGDDRALGGRGNDTLRGSGGSDALIGGGGADTLIGGRGDDLLRSAGTASGTHDLLVPGDGADFVEALSGGERIYLGIPDGDVDEVWCFGRGARIVYRQLDPKDHLYDCGDPVIIG